VGGGRSGEFWGIGLAVKSHIPGSACSTAGLRSECAPVKRTRPVPGLGDEVLAERFGAGGDAQLAECLDLDLADALAGEAEVLADLVER